MLRVTTKRFALATMLAIVAPGLLCLYHPFRRNARITTQTVVAHVHRPSTAPFPDIPAASLTPLQQRVIALAKQEYAKKPVSYDADVLKYTDGVSEPWCADFASWIFKQAGQPFSNPNSGSWRIPGVYTLQDYFTLQHHYTLAGSYVPKTGDIAIYHAGQGHTNIVLSVHDGQMTTIGGNEGGHIVIRAHSYARNVEGLDGFGVLQN